jgi:hypothetical protein
MATFSSTITAAGLASKSASPISNLNLSSHYPQKVSCRPRQLPQREPARLTKKRLLQRRGGGSQRMNQYRQHCQPLPVNCISGFTGSRGFFAPKLERFLGRHRSRSTFGLFGANTEANDRCAHTRERSGDAGGQQTRARPSRRREAPWRSLALPTRSGD